MIFVVEFCRDMSGTTIQRCKMVIAQDKKFSGVSKQERLYIRAVMQKNLQDLDASWKRT